MTAAFLPSALAAGRLPGNRLRPGSLRTVPSIFRPGFSQQVGVFCSINEHNVQNPALRVLAAFFEKPGRPMEKTWMSGAS